jgi:2-C-methyl-D-erythritol 4-phosphate cytidylyltransferase
MSTYAIIPAGGNGTRSGSSTPKQFLKFKGKELIAYTLDVFQRNSSIDEIIVAAESVFLDLLNRIKKEYNFTKLSQIVEGGKERQDSVYSALNVIDAKEDDLVAVHDAARPLLPKEILTSALKTAKEKGNAVVCLKAKDTLLKGDTIIEEHLNRNKIFYVQTPQIFKYEDLEKAMDWAHHNNFIGSDESMLVEKIGIDVNIVEGSVFNFKVTTSEDLRMFESLVIFSI